MTGKIQSPEVNIHRICNQNYLSPQQDRDTNHSYFEIGFGWFRSNESKVLETRSVVSRFHQRPSPTHQYDAFFPRTASVLFAHVMEFI